MNYPDHRQNPAWQALHRAVEKAKADGAPVYVNQPAPPTAQSISRAYDAEAAGINKLERVIAYLQADAFQCARSWAHGCDAAGPELLGSHAALKLTSKIWQKWIESI